MPTPINAEGAPLQVPSLTTPNQQATVPVHLRLCDDDVDPDQEGPGEIEVPYRREDYDNPSWEDPDGFDYGLPPHLCGDHEVTPAEQNESVAVGLSLSPAQLEEAAAAAAAAAEAAAAADAAAAATANANAEAAADAADCWAMRQLAIDQQSGWVLNYAAPFDNAMTFIDRVYSFDEQPTLHLFAKSIYVFDGKRYEEKDDDFLVDKLYRFLNRGVVFTGRDGEPKTFRPNQRHVEQLQHALKGLVFVDSKTFPCWATKVVGAPEVKDLIPFNNGLLNIKQWLMKGEDRLVPHTPALLSTSLLPMDFDPQATCPQWRKFLNQVLPDAESIEALQLWFGYCMTQDTTQHKMLMLFGPPRSGKSTILKMLEAILGEHSTAAISLSSLGSEFGQQSLIGKLAAFISDAHLRSSDRVRVLELLKCISGEDKVSINRKHKDQLTMRLGVRFSMATNDLMVFPDASGSLVKRMIIIPVPNTFEGREDRGLEALLLTELPGICNWALAGLRKYHETGRLLQPQAGSEALAEMECLGSPYQDFVKNMCVYPAVGQTTSTEDMWFAWQDWCIHQNQAVQSRPTFGKGIASACPMVKRVNRGAAGDREWRYENIAISAAGRKFLWGVMTPDQKKDALFYRGAEERRRQRRIGKAG